MHNPAFNRTFLRHTASGNSNKRVWNDYHEAIFIAFGSGLFFMLIGFLLTVVSTIFGRSNPVLTLAGVSLMIIAFSLFGIGAHFMDKSDDSERQAKRARIAKYK